jgi:hypothetical protein
MPRARDLLAAATTFPALRAAALRAARGHRRTADAALFLCDLERNLLDLQRRLSDKTWEPGPLRTFHIRNPSNARVANRNRNTPGNRNNNLGFRLASPGIARSVRLRSPRRALS